MTLKMKRLAVAMTLISAQAYADDGKHHFDIPAQNLASALQQLANQSGAAMLYAEHSAAGKTSPVLKGDYTIEEAIRKLLTGSGLTYSIDGDGTVTLRPVSSANDATTLGAVTVTGQAVYDAKDPYNPDYVLPNATAGTKTDTPIMETPLNVQVISKQVMKDQQVVNLDQALKNVSGVTVVGNAADAAFDGGLLQSVVLRGFESQFFFRNGFRLQQGAASRAMANVESVEVLKGPAAILYGMVEPGGMVNVITKQPLETPYYALNQQFGSFDFYRTTIDATGPVTNNKDLLYRMNMSYQNSGSFRQFVDKEDVFLAPVLKWNISPKTQASFELEYDHNHFGADSAIMPMLNGKTTNIPRSRNYGEYSPATTESVFGGFTLAHQFNDDWSIKQRFSINQQHNHQPKFLLRNGVTDNDIHRFGAGWDFQYNTYSSNIDLTGHFNTFGLKHTLLLGGDYYHLHTKKATSYSLDSSSGTFYESTINLFNPVHPGSPLPMFPSSLLANDTDQYGAYIQDQIKLPYGFHVMGGIRYQNLHQASTDEFNPGADSAQSQDAVTPRVGMLWQPQSWLSLYANYVESFGANTGIVYPNKVAPASSAEQYEGGIKTEFFDGRLRANLAYYDLTKTNIPSSDPDPAHQNYVIVTGAARSRGPELDISGEILPGWNMIATYAYTDVRVIKTNANNEPARNGTVAVGSRYFNVPRNTACYWNTYEFRDSDLKGLKLGGGVTLRDGQTGCCDVPAATIPGYATVDLLAAYSVKVAGAKITTQLNINNLLDKRYYTGLLSSGANSPSYSLATIDFGQPRSVIGSINIQY
ncbi:MAG: TonB-dependent receptor [Methylococcaceae bacterium]|nr:TonB-dependent receptor [Methylococcaceae bacterium]